MDAPFDDTHEMKYEMRDLLQLLRSLLTLIHEKVQPFIESPGSYFDLGWDLSRSYFFSLIFISLLLAKLLHIYAYFSYLTFPRFLLWGPTFFILDAVVILLVYGLTRAFRWRASRVGAAVIIVPLRYKLIDKLFIRGSANADRVSIQLFSLF